LIGIKTEAKGIFRKECKMKLIKVDCVNENCPIPLVETRRALRKASEGDVIEIKGTHSASKKEIPMAVDSMGYELLSVDEKDEIWNIKIKK
jgi:TusA-related sulfurtransferase